MSTLPPVPEGGMGTPPIIPAPAFSLFQRLHFFVRAHIIKGFVTSYFNVVSLLGIHQKQGSPTFIKVYQKGLTNRVFVPKSWKSGDAPLPLYLDIHGGGFTICSPMVDDRFCREFSDNNNFLVVSLDYPKAPAHPYPAPLVALIKAVKDVLADEALPFDEKKVAIGGFSAGANLALAVSQDEALHGKIGGVASFYAPLDFATDTKVKLATRPAHAGPDPLANIGPVFNWGYVPAGTNLKDPQLSPSMRPHQSSHQRFILLAANLIFCAENQRFLPSDWQANEVAKLLPLVPIGRKEA
ncbi:Alpha/Beta hydrolase protein [Bisporella sp. PMI_857]|nr:Alpha/Beta hydrolase protein [Bisporella sp. PMI_857]